MDEIKDKVNVNQLVTVCNWIDEACDNVCVPVPMKYILLSEVIRMSGLYYNKTWSELRKLKDVEHA